MGGRRKKAEAAKDSACRFPRGKRQADLTAVLETIISIHASHGGSDMTTRSVSKVIKISIHASREGSDFAAGDLYIAPFISIHASREGRDSATALLLFRACIFQSTLPAGEATVRSSCPLMTARSSMGSANRDFPVFLSAVSMLFFFWALGVRAYRIMVSLGSYPFFVPI